MEQREWTNPRRGICSQNFAGSTEPFQANASLEEFSDIEDGGLPF